MKINLLIVLFLLAACTHSTENKSITLPPVTPAAIAAKLAPVTSLDDAAQQLASALDLTPTAVRVRIKGACSVCDAEKLQKATSLNGVTVPEAKKLLQANYDFWLFVQNFTCTYHFDGKTYTPQSCQFSAL